MKQTAVEWLINELHKTRDYQRVINEANQSGSSVRDVIKQSKEMENGQIIEAYQHGITDEHGDTITFKTEGEDYYNKTYGADK
jgi:hypothetical protein